MKFIDLFSGVGGFRLGLERIGEYRCVWSCDWDKYANRVYTKHFGADAHYSGDIKGVDPRDIPDFDLLCAGFPCQSFSVAGKRKGFADSRGTLFYEILRVAEAKKPPLLLLENVRGLLSNDRGQTFAAILRELGRVGYWCEWQVLNSKHFGVPQNRERVFVVGHLGEGGGQPIFPVTEADGLPNEEPEGEEGVASCLDANYHKGARRQRTFVVGNIFSKEAADGRVYSPEGLSPSLRGFSYGWSKPKIIDVYNKSLRADQESAGALKGEGVSNTSLGTALGVTLANTSRYKDANRNPAQSEGLSWALNSAGDQGVLENMKIRRLTPVECERLQGFPDGWTEGISDSQRYKLLGNAVTVPVIEFLGKRLREASCFHKFSEAIV